MGFSTQLDLKDGKLSFAVGFYSFRLTVERV